MDWLPQSLGGGSSQWVALASYRDLDEVRPHPLTTPPLLFHCVLPQVHSILHAESFKGAIQLWDLGPITNAPRKGSSKLPSQLPKLGAVIAHEYGCIRALKWYHSHPGSDSSTGHAQCKTKGGGGGEGDDLLGLLSLACGDGCVRILS